MRCQAAQKSSKIHVRKALVRHLLDVGAGRERLFRPGDDDAADGVVAFECVERRREFAHQRGVERIERLPAG